MTRSLSSSCPRAAGTVERNATKVSGRITFRKFTMSSLSIVLSPRFDPSLDDANLTGGQVRWPVQGHLQAYDPRATFELVNQVAVVGISRGHSSQCGPLARWNTYQSVVGTASGREVQPDSEKADATGPMTGHTRRTP